MVKIIVNYATTEKRYVIVEDNKVRRMNVDQPSQRSLVGNIYLGLVTKVLPGMNAVFVDIGEEKQGFLQMDKLVSFAKAANSNNQKSISTFVHQGEWMLVQVDKDAFGSKGPRLTGIIEFQGGNLIYMPHGGFVATSQKIIDSNHRAKLKVFGESIIENGEGLIFRTNSVNLNFDELNRELTELREQFTQLQKEAAICKAPKLLYTKDLFLAHLLNDLNNYTTGEIWIDDLVFKQKLEKLVDHKYLDRQFSLQFYQGKENIFSAMGVGNEVERALKRVVWLKNGAFLVIDEAEALTIFDVNSGKFVGKSNRQVTGYQVNAEAAMEAARQIILRDIGGIILIDFIDMKQNWERDSILKVLETEFKQDIKKPKIVGFTDLGIIQITRRKTKPTLSESLLTKCSTCDGTGRVYSPESIAFQMERELWEYRQSDFDVVYVTTTEDVYHLFTGNQAVHLQRLEEMIGMKIDFTTRPANKPFYEITKFGSL